MKCYSYDNIDDYLIHLNELSRKGIKFSLCKTENEYREMFRKYEDFVIYVDGKIIKYGSSGYAKERNLDITKYKIRTNVYNY